MKRCKVEISAHMHHDEAYCEVLLNHEKFQPPYVGKYPISQEDCEKAHATGTLNLDLGNRIFRTTGLNNPGETKITEYMEGASTNLEVHMAGLIQHKCLDTGPPLVLGKFMIYLDIETAFLDHEASQISLPRLGLQAAFNRNQSFFTHYSVEYGRVYMNISQERNQGFRVAVNDLPCALYEDTIIHSTRDHPDIAVVDMGEGKTLALQVHGTKQIMGRHCNVT